MSSKYWQNGHKEQLHTLSSALRDERWAADNSLEMVISQIHLTPPQTAYVTIPQAWINCFIYTVVTVADLINNLKQYACPTAVPLPVLSLPCSKAEQGTHPDEKYLSQLCVYICMCSLYIQIYSVNVQFPSG